jgi:hypothetical protein
MIKVDFDTFASAVISNISIISTFEFLTQVGHGLQASMLSINVNNLSKDQALSILQLKRECFFEEWDLDLINNREGLRSFYNSRFTPSFLSLQIKDFWINFENLISSINYTTHNKNKYTKRKSELYLGTKSLKFSDMEKDGSLQLNKITLQTNNFIQYQDIIECFWDNKISLTTSYFIVTTNKYYLVVEDIIC